MTQTINYTIAVYETFISQLSHRHIRGLATTIFIASLVYASIERRRWVVAEGERSPMAVVLCDGVAHLEWVGRRVQIVTGLRVLEALFFACLGDFIEGGLIDLEDVEAAVFAIVDHPCAGNLLRFAVRLCEEGRAWQFLTFVFLHAHHVRLGS